MLTKKVDRRKALIMGVVLLAAPYAINARIRSDRRRQILSYVKQLSRDPALVKLGQAAIAQDARFRDANKLDLAQQMADDLPVLSNSTIEALLASKAEADLAEARFVRIDGWVLAASEGQLLTLIYLESRT